MRSVFLFLAALIISWGCSLAKFDEFEDGDDAVEYDDNDFAEFEDVVEDVVTESPQRVITTEDDEEEATVELEGQDENQEDFDDADAQVVSRNALPHFSCTLGIPLCLQDPDRQCYPRLFFDSCVVGCSVSADLPS